MEIKLPYDNSPLASCYHNIAFPLGVIQGNANERKIDITPWIIAKYLNCMFNESSRNNKYEICLYDGWGLDDGIVRHQYIDMYTYMYEKMQIDSIKLIKGFLCENCYITGQYNEKHIPGKIAFQKYDYVHDYIIYGFDDKRNVLFSSAFLSDEKYQAFEIPFDCFTNSLYDSPHDRIQFDLWKYNHQYQYKLDVDRIKNGVCDYLDSTNRYDNSNRNNRHYGLKANAKLKEYFDYCVSVYNIPEVDLRYSRAFMEHKYFFYLCVQYLYNNKIIHLTQYDFQQIESIYRMSYLIYMLSIKFNTTQKNSYLDKIMKLFAEIEKTELVVISKVNSLLSVN